MSRRVLSRMSTARLFVIDRPTDEAQRRILEAAEVFWLDRALTLPGCEHLADCSPLASLCAVHPRTLARCPECYVLHLGREHSGSSPVTMAGTVDVEGVTPSGRGWGRLSRVTVVVADAP